jgi:hypothetical protein
MEKENEASGGPTGEKGRCRPTAEQRPSLLILLDPHKEARRRRRRRQMNKICACGSSKQQLMLQ